MPPIAYTVTATLPDEALAREYLAWLLDGHVGEVVRHGATVASVVRVTEPAIPIRIETRYEFPDAPALAAYISGPAQALREHGLARFPPRRGVALERRVGEVVAVQP